MANDSIRGRQVVLRLTNKSGGALVEGDVVIISSGTAAAITTTTTAGLATDMIGVCLESIAGDALGRVCISGYVPKINLSGAASLGDTFATHTVAKQAAPAAARAQGHFGEVLGTGTTPAALLWGLPDPPTAAGNVATDAIWDAAGDLAVGTGSNTAGRLALGTAYQIPRVKSDASTLEYVSAGKVLLSEQTPTGTGTVTFSSIPATFKTLELEYVARSTEVAATSVIQALLNNDATATNYRTVSDYASAGGTTGGSGGDSSQYGRISAASAPAGSCGVGYVRIPNYAGTAFRKQVFGLYSLRYDDATTFMLTGNLAFEWENTAAVNRVDFVLAAGNYDTGSTFRLYGVF